MYDQRARDKVAFAVNVRHQSMTRGKSDHEKGCRPNIGVKSCVQVSIAQSGSSVDAKSVLRNVPVTVGLTSHPTREEVRTFSVCQCRNSVSQSRRFVPSHVLCTVASVHQ